MATLELWNLRGKLIRFFFSKRNFADHEKAKHQHDEDVKDFEKRVGNHVVLLPGACSLIVLFFIFAK